MPGANRLTLDATLAERADLRYTPAGVPALECVLKHASVQREAGGMRKVDCELAAVAFGEPARALAAIAAACIRCVVPKPSFRIVRSSRPGVPGTGRCSC